MDNDAQQILDEYLQRVGELFADVENWIDPTKIKTSKAEISIAEEACGTYTTSKLILNTQENKPIAEIVPIAAWAVGANGRMDIHGIYDNIILLHLNQGGPTITTTIQDGKRTTSETRPIYRGITDAGWYAIDRRTSKGHRFNKETLFDALSEVSDYEP